MALKQITRVNIAEKVFEQLRDQILQGTWKEGEKLPSEQELTETLGVSRQSVSKWENGSSDPNTSNLIALSKLYKISPEELLECATRTPEED